MAIRGGNAISFNIPIPRAPSPSPLPSFYFTSSARMFLPSAFHFDTLLKDLTQHGKFRHDLRVARCCVLVASGHGGDFTQPFLLILVVFFIVTQGRANTLTIFWNILASGLQYNILT